MNRMGIFVKIIVDKLLSRFIGNVEGYFIPWKIIAILWMFIELHIFLNTVEWNT